MLMNAQHCYLSTQRRNEITRDAIKPTSASRVQNIIEVLESSRYIMSNAAATVSTIHEKITPSKLNCTPLTVYVQYTALSLVCFRSSEDCLARTIYMALCNALVKSTKSYNSSLIAYIWE